MFNPMSHSELEALKGALNEVLNKSATIGHQTPASGGGTLGALVPQSIENTLSNATYNSADAVLWKDIPKTTAAQTVHEYVRVTQHGVEGLSPFFAEGGVPGTNRGVYERAAAKIKFLGEKREITDVASMVGLLGGNANALAEETTRGTLSLLRKIEHNIFHGDEDMSAVEWDGIFKSMAASGGNVTNMEGGTVSAQLLQDVCGEVFSAPYYGRPDTIYMEPRMHSELIKQTVNGGRHDQLKTMSGAQVTFGVSDIGINAPYGFVKIKAAPFMFDAAKAPSAGYGDYIPATPSLSVAIAAGASAASKFVAADAGDYIYKAVAVSDTGFSAPLTTAAVTVAAGESVTFTIADPSDTAVKHYKIYRTPVGGLAASAQMIARVAKGATTTAVTDNNTNRTGASKVLFAQNDPEIYEFARLLDLIRRPLHSLTTTRPFLIMMFGTPIVKVPEKMWVLENLLPNSGI